MNNEVIISCAVTGGGETQDKHPRLPITPEQIATAAIDAAKAGAAIVHIHARDPETGRNSRDPELFKEIFHRIRDSETDVCINITGGNGGDWKPSAENPNVGTPDSDNTDAETRLIYISALKPEIASLDCGAMAFGESTYIAQPSLLRHVAGEMQRLGIKAEIECFHTGHVALANQLYAEGLFDDPPLYQLCLGIQWGSPATTEGMKAMRDMLPDGAVWASFGISRHQIPMAAQAVLMGGNVRVGLEDNLYLERGVFADNWQLVEKARTVVELMGARILTPQEAREKLNLKKQN